MDGYPDRPNEVATVTDSSWVHRLAELPVVFDVTGREVFTFGFDLRDYGHVPGPPTG
jgi:hypothetical protein